jgi:hypothetical protein
VRTVESYDVLWRSPLFNSMEHFQYRGTDQTHTMEGTVVLAREATPATIHYTLSVGPTWELIDATIRCTTTEDVTIAIASEKGEWWIDGQQRVDLSGCTDLDLGWTPATNTLPIRRTRLAEGEEATIDAVWVTFPELAVVRAEQTYMRQSASVWRYSSGDFAAELHMGPFDIVADYGPGFWATQASASVNQARS